MSKTSLPTSLTYVKKVSSWSVPKPLPVLVDVSPIRVRPLGTAATISEDDAVALAVRLKALADPVRLRLLGYMLDQPDQEACTCELAPFVGLSDPTVSHHLKTLERAGLVTKERRGMSVHYRVVPEAIHAIAKALHLAVC
jgi:ArsR family transcriptional regulator, arsenate/arsenite/antimonite-responsive transcriptional repressor